MRLYSRLLSVAVGLALGLAPGAIRADLIINFPLSTQTPTSTQAASGSISEGRQQGDCSASASAAHKMLSATVQCAPSLPPADDPLGAFATNSQQFSAYAGFIDGIVLSPNRSLQVNSIFIEMSASLTPIGHGGVLPDDLSSSASYNAQLRVGGTQVWANGGLYLFDGLQPNTPASQRAEVQYLFGVPTIVEIFAAVSVDSVATAFAGDPAPRQNHTSMAASLSTSPIRIFDADGGEFEVIYSAGFGSFRSLSAPELADGYVGQIFISSASGTDYTVPIPEPSSAVLVAAGVTLLVARSRRI